MWVRRYQELASKLNKFVGKRERKHKSATFSLWMSLTTESIFNTKQILKHQTRWNLKAKKTYLRAWKDYSVDRYERKQMKVVSQFYFIKKALTRVLHSWRMTAKADSMARVNEDFKAKSVLEECFLVLKKHYYGK